MEDRYKAYIAGIGIMCLTGIELYALHQGLNSVLFGSIVAAISGIVGLCFGLVIGRKQ